LPAWIECGTQYRPDAETMVDAVEDDLRVEPSSGLRGDATTIEYETMTLAVAYVGDAPEGRNVTVEVTTSDGDPIVRDLYQIGEMRLTDVEFSGGHGFTGLQYVSHEEAMLQVWCEAIGG
jgi:hypothetical protein